MTRFAAAAVEFAGSTVHDPAGTAAAAVAVAGTGSCAAAGMRGYAGDTALPLSETSRSVAVDRAVVDVILQRA